MPGSSSFTTSRRSGASPDSIPLTFTWAMRCRSRSGREQLSVDVLERLELEGVARRVEEKKRCLLSGLALETDVRLDHETDPVLLQSLGQRRPGIHFQHHTAVRYRHAVAIDRVVVRRDPSLRAQGGIQVAHELMAEQVEVHPL